MGGIFLINLFMMIQGTAFIRLFVHVSRVAENILLPCIIILCTIGAFTITNNVFQVAILIAFSMVGFLMKKFNMGDNWVMKARYGLGSRNRYRKLYTGAVLVGQRKANERSSLCAMVGQSALKDVFVGADRGYEGYNFNINEPPQKNRRGSIYARDLKVGEAWYNAKT